MSKETTAAATTDEEKVKEYFKAVLEAFSDKAEGYVYPKKSIDLKERFKRVTEVKEALRAIGKPDTFGIGAVGPYSGCPSGDCNGGVCTRTLSFTEAELRELAKRLEA